MVLDLEPMERGDRMNQRSRIEDARGNVVRSTNRWRRTLLSVLAVGLGLVAAVAVAELAVRIFVPGARDHALPRELVSPDPVLGWRLAQDETVVHRTSHFETCYRTNHLGFRDRQRERRKTGNERRVLLFGDSQVFGWGVPEGERFSDLAEAALPSVEVWNLGVPGYGLDQEVLAGEGGDEPLDADIVVLYLSEATLHRLSFSHIFGLSKPFFTVDGEGGLELHPPRRNAGRALLDRAPRWLFLPYFVDRQLAVLDDRLGRSRRLASEPGSDLLLIERLLDRALSTAHARGQRLALMMVLPSRAREPIERICAARSVASFGVELPGSRQDLTYGSDDPHWNATAHALIAEELVPFLSTLVGP